MQAREAKLAVYQANLPELQAKKAIAQVYVSPKALTVALAVWRGQIEATSQDNDVRVLRNLLFPVLSQKPSWAMIKPGCGIPSRWMGLRLAAFGVQRRLVRS